jgi:hypothetical protein
METSAASHHTIGEWFFSAATAAELTIAALASVKFTPRPAAPAATEFATGCVSYACPAV